MTQELFQQLVSVIREEVGGLEKRFDAKLDKVRLELKQDIAEVHARIDEVHERIDQVHARIDSVHERIDEVHERIDAVHAELKHDIAEVHSKIDAKIDAVKDSLSYQISQVKRAVLETREELGQGKNQQVEQQQRLVRLETRFERHEAGNRERFTTLNGRLRQVERRWRPRRRLVR